MQLSFLVFNRWDVRRLRAAMSATKDKQTYVRLQAVCDVALGDGIAKVSLHINKSSRSVYRWCALYLRHHDPKDLMDAPRSGRPRSAQAITEKRILQALDQNPHALGYQTGGWTVVTLAEYLSRRYHCLIAAHTLRRRMKQMGLRYKRPRYVYEEKDPNRSQKKGQLSAS